MWLGEGSHPGWWWSRGQGDRHQPLSLCSECASADLALSAGTERETSTSSRAIPRIVPILCVWSSALLLGAAFCIAHPRVINVAREVETAKFSLFGISTPPASWHICPDAGGACTGAPLQRWKTDPRGLANEVEDSLGSLGGIPSSVYEPIAQKWRQSPPHFNGRQVRLEDIAAFMRQLLSGDPFGTGQEVPHLDFSSPGGGKMVALTQRQLAFIVANALMGNALVQGDGLSAALKRCSSKENTARAYLQSLLSLLAVLSQELASAQAHGTTIVVATPVSGNPPGLDWRPRLWNHTLSEPTVCTQVPGQTSRCGLHDFMSGGTPFQALTDIAGTVVGGGASLCEVANSQDESLVQFYSEILALAFFVIPGRLNMLPVPMAFLGVRRYMGEIEGENSNGPPFWNICGRIPKHDWLNTQIQIAGTVDTVVAGAPTTLAASSFVAVASLSSGSRGGCGVGKAVNNQCMNQRDHLDQDIGLWYTAFSAQHYNLAAQQAFSNTVRSIGTGPWGAGVWFGDSQQYFLAVWVATSLLAGGTGLDYYIYDHFCENPSNQCFLLGGKACQSCIAGAKVTDSQVRPESCGDVNIWDMVMAFKGKPVHDLYDVLRTVAPPPDPVFDLLLPQGAAVGSGPIPPPPRPPKWNFIPPQPVAPVGQGQGNNYRKEVGVGGWGGICTCPDGKSYQVGDNKNECASLACEFGKAGPCSATGITSANSGMKVTCALPVAPPPPAAPPASPPSTQSPSPQPTIAPPVTVTLPTPAGFPPAPAQWASFNKQVPSQPQAPNSRQNFYRRSNDVGDWGGLCECPDGKLYEVGDNNDYCQSLACEFGKAGQCSAHGILSINRGMKVTCAHQEGA